MTPANDTLSSPLQLDRAHATGAVFYQNRVQSALR